MNRLDSEDFRFLAANAKEAAARGVEGLHHLDQPTGILSYLRIANDIARRLAPCRVLDWGCGFGQMTYLLRRRGFEVLPYDLGAAELRLPDIPLCRTIEVVRSTDFTRLPFDSASFGAVLSCGVLEHVDEVGQPGDERLCLREIHRVLRPRGALLIYQLPQRLSWQEALARRLRLGYTHSRRYTGREVARILEEEGFVPGRVRRVNLLPKNLPSLPGAVRAAWGRMAVPIMAADAVLCRIAPLNRIAGALELHARKP